MMPPYGSGSYCHGNVHHLDHGHGHLPLRPNGSKVLSLALRLVVLALALASAVVMLTSTDCATAAAATTTAAAGYTRYTSFVYLAGCNIAVTFLQALAIVLQALLLAKAGADPADCTDHHDDEDESQVPEVLSTAMDVLTLALLFSATGAAYATAPIGGATCRRFVEQVVTAKALSLGTGVGAALAVVLKQMKLPFNILPPAAYA